MYINRLFFINYPYVAIIITNMTENTSTLLVLVFNVLFSVFVLIFINVIGLQRFFLSNLGYKSYVIYNTIC